MINVLSTKTLDADVVEMAQLAGINLQSHDFIEVVGRTADITLIDAAAFDGLVFTSANAVNFFFEQTGLFDLLNTKNVLALSGKTSDELLARDIQPVFTSVNADGLARLIIQTQIVKSVLHICGNLTLNVLETKLKSAGIDYTPLVVYDTLLAPAVIADNHFEVVLFFSPSGVESFLMKNKLSDSAICCCIGTTTSAALREKLPGVKIIFPRERTPESMIEAVVRYYKTGE